MDILAIIQARMGSSRLPDKVLKDLAGKPVLWHVVNRVKKSKLINEVVVATTYRKEDLAIVEYCASQRTAVYVGSDEDVLERYYQAARLYKPVNVVRVTADCPLIDAKVIDTVIQEHLKSDCDYTSNTLEDTFPDGLDCEVFKFTALEQACQNAKLVSEREHVTPYIRKNKQYKKHSVTDSEDHSLERWTLDTDRDYAFLTRVFEELYKDNPEFDTNDVYALLNRCPDIRKLNAGIIRNEGYLKSLENDKIFME